MTKSIAGLGSVFQSSLQKKLLQVVQRATNKACMMYKIMDALVDVKPTAGLLEPKNHSSRSQFYRHARIAYVKRMRVYHREVRNTNGSRKEKKNTHLHSSFPSTVRLWHSVPTGAPSAVSPQWGVADAEIKVPSGENIELKRSPIKAWSRSVYSHTCYAYCKDFLPRLFLPFRSIHLHFFQDLSQ